MLYHVSRNGETFGPYTLEDLQRYLATGNVLPTDLARSDDTAEWIPVSQIVGAPRGPTSPPLRPTPHLSPAIPTRPTCTGCSCSPYLLDLRTFFFICEFVQAIWVTKIVPGARVVYYLIAMIVLWVLMMGAFFSQFATMFGQMSNPGTPPHFGGAYFLTMLFIYPLMFIFYLGLRRVSIHHAGPDHGSLQPARP